MKLIFKWRGETIKRVGLVVVSAVSIAATNANFGVVEINSALRARSNGRNFYSWYRGNYLQYAVQPKTIGVVRKIRHFLSGNMAYQVEITHSPNGQHLHDLVWIYDDVKYHPGRLTICKDVSCRITTSNRRLVRAVRTEVKMPVIKVGHVAQRQPIYRPQRPIYRPRPIRVVRRLAPAPVHRRFEPRSSLLLSPQIEYQPLAPLLPPAHVHALRALHTSTDTCTASCLPRTENNNRGINELRRKDVSVFTRSPVIGARKIMATIYQSCHVLDKRPYDWSQRVPGWDYVRFQDIENGFRHWAVGIRAGYTADVDRHQYYMRDLQSPPECRDMRQTPVSYFYGGKPVAQELRHRVIDVFQNRAWGTNHAPSVGLDCSAFVSTAFLAAGLRLTAGPNPQTYMTAQQFLYAANPSNPRSCFVRPQMSPNKSLKAGDVISFGTHVLMINSVGPDPFGLNKRHPPGTPLTLRDCFKPLNRRDLNFTFIQSVGNNQSGPGADNVGVAITSASSFLAGDMKKQMAIWSFAKQECEAKVLHRAVPEFPSREWALIRHNSSNKACIDPKGPMKVKGFQCLRSCFTDELQKGI